MMTRKQYLRIITENTPIEQILTTDEGRDFIEVVGTVGGDVLQYRIYEDGRVYER